MCTSEIVFKFGNDLFQLPNFHALEFKYDCACTCKDQFPALCNSANAEPFKLALSLH